MTVSRARVKRRMSDLVTYSQFRKEEEAKRERCNVGRGRTVSEWMRDKLTGLRNYESSKNASHDVIQSCSLSRSLEGKMRSSEQRMLLTLNVQRYKKYEAVCGRPSIQF